MDSLQRPGYPATTYQREKQRSERQTHKNIRPTTAKTQPRRAERESALSVDCQHSVVSPGQTHLSTKSFSASQETPKASWIQHHHSLSEVDLADLSQRPCLKTVPEKLSWVNLSAKWRLDLEEEQVEPQGGKRKEGLKRSWSKSLPKRRAKVREELVAARRDRKDDPQVRQALKVMLEEYTARFINKVAENGNRSS